MRRPDPKRIAIESAPKGAKLVRVSWEGDCLGDVDLENGIVYEPMFLGDKVDAFVHGGSRPQPQPSQSTNRLALAIIQLMVLGSLAAIAYVVIGSLTNG